MEGGREVECTPLLTARSQGHAGSNPALSARRIVTVLRDVVTGQVYVDRMTVCESDGHLFGCHPQFWERNGRPGLIHPEGVFCREPRCPKNLDAQPGEVPESG